MSSEIIVRLVARAICKSRTCEGISCCEWPAQAGQRHNCKAANGAYDDAARDAIEAYEAAIGISVQIYDPDYH